jgi:hypothetical protein
MSRLFSLLSVCFRHFQQPILGALLLHYTCIYWPSHYTCVYLPNDRRVRGIYLLNCKDQSHRHSILTYFDASNRHSFTPALATRSGAASHSGICSPRRWQHARGLCPELTLLHPGVGNTLGGCTSNWHSFDPALATRSGAMLNARILVAIYQFGCRISNTKVSPRFATPDGLVFVSSALCREIFHTYGMKFAPMDASSASQ